MTNLNVSCIQRFSTGDGPGIRTTVFLKGCNLNCPWCHNPENQSASPQTLCYKTGKKITYGKTMTIQEIIDDVLEDIDFYRESGGGVTFSGGEPLLQSKGLSELVKALKEKGISVLIDTAGCLPWENFEDVIDDTEIFYFDFKTADDMLYKTVISGDKTLILSNLNRLIERNKIVHVRIPLIPGFNMKDEDCERICADLSNVGVKYVDLLPFHRLGSSKYEALGMDYAYKNVTPPLREDIEKIKKIYEKYFVTCIE